MSVQACNELKDEINQETGYVRQTGKGLHVGYT